MYTLLASILISGSLVASIAQAKTSKPIVVTPQGLTKKVSQVKIEFPTEMIRLGSDQVAVNIAQVNCQPAQLGSARWITPLTWVYEFKAKKKRAAQLNGATTCTVTLKKNLKDIKDQPVAVGKNRFQFSVDGPNLVEVVRPGSWQLGSISEDQAFLIQTDVPATISSIEKAAYFSVAGIGSRFGLRVLKGAERDTTLKAIYGSSSYDKKRRTQIKNDPRFHLVRAKNNFPAGQSIALYFGKGIQAKTGYIRKLVERYNKKINVRPPLIAQIRCSAYDRKNKTAQINCSPYSQIFLNFSAEIPVNQIKGVQLRDPRSQKVWLPKYIVSSSQSIRQLSFEPPFPVSQELRLEFSGSTPADDMGRSLSNLAGLLKPILITEIPSLISFNSSFGILDSQKNNNSTFLPVTVRNIEPQLLVSEPSATQGVIAQGATQKYGFQNFSSVVSWLKKINSSPSGEKSVLLSSSKRTFQVPLIERNKAGDLVPHQVAGIPLQGKGFFVTEIKSPKLASSQKVQKNQPTTYVRTTSLVTDLAIHLKHGNDSSLVWVTNLKTGQPVSGAQVVIANCKGISKWSGQTDSEGLIRISESLSQYIKISCLDKKNPWNSNRYDRGFFAVAKKGDDFSFTHSAWKDGITPWRFGVPASYEISLTSPNSNVIVHGIFDRPLYRSGEEVYIKYLARKKTGGGFSIPNSSLSPSHIEISDPIDGKKIYSGSLSWNAKEGEAAFSWKIPKDAPVGTYDISLSNPKSKKFYSGGVIRISEFKVPNMKGQLQLTAQRPFPTNLVKADFVLGYSNGGPAKKWPVQLSYTINELSDLNIKEYGWLPFSRGTYKQVTGDERAAEKTHTRDLKLDANGTGDVDISLKSHDPTKPYQVKAELIYRDSNGEVNTLFAQESVWPSSHVIGLKESDKARTFKQIQFDLAVVNSEKKPGFTDVDTPIFAIYRRDSYSVSRRVPGGFYEQEQHTVITPVHALVQCQKKKESSLFYDCKTKVEKGGNYIIEASISKKAQLLSTTHLQTFVSSNDPNDHAPDLSKSDRIDLLPNKKEYVSGDMARFNIKTPYKIATALISVEREGVIETYVKIISRANPYFELKVNKSWAPNVFVSAMVVRGRVGTGPKQIGAIDLSKPSFKMGLTKVKVDWLQNKLDIKIATVGKKFKPRAQIKTTLLVKNAKTGKAVANAKIVLALVDESLLGIRKNSSWELLEKMMRQRSLQVFTSTGKLQIVGRRHFGLKATPHGGGGGLAPTRELFDTLAYWSDQIKTDDNGVATLHIPINSDSLSSFRLVAIGYKGASLFGKGSTSIRTALDVMIQSGLPAILRDSDQIQPDFTFRNTTSKNIGLNVTLNWIFSSKGKLASTEQQTSKQTLSANDSLRFNFKSMPIPLGTEKATYTLTLTDENGKIVDSIRKSIPVYDSVEVLPTMAAIAQISQGGRESWEIERPMGAIPGRGKIMLSKSNSLIGSLTAFDTFKKLQTFKDTESRLAVALISTEDENWTELKKDLASGQYTDGKGLVKQYKTSQYGSAWLTSLILIAAPSSGHSLGKTTREGFLNALEQQLKENRGRKRNSLSTQLRITRALALHRTVVAGDLQSLKTQKGGPAQWTLSELLDWVEIHRYLGSQDYSQVKAIGLKALKDRMILQGRSASLPGSSSASYFENGNSVQSGWINWLISELGDDTITKSNLTLPLTMGLIQKMKSNNGYWYLPATNIWAFQALTAFSKKYEHGDVSGSTIIELRESGGQKSQRMISDKNSESLSLAWPAKRGELTIEHTGLGQPWVQVQGEAAVPLKTSIAAGFSMDVKIKKVAGSTGDSWRIGDVYEARYSIVPGSPVPSAGLFIPIPAGASIISSSSSTYGDFSEETYQGYKAVLSSLRGGESIEVVLKIRLNNAGVFRTPSAWIKSTYTPEMRSITPVGVWTVIQ